MKQKVTIFLMAAMAATLGGCASKGDPAAEHDALVQKQIEHDTNARDAADIHSMGRENGDEARARGDFPTALARYQGANKAGALVIPELDAAREARFAARKAKRGY